MMMMPAMRSKKQALKNSNAFLTHEFVAIIGLADWIGHTWLLSGASRILSPTTSTSLASQASFSHCF
jgi:hypothetical protein